VKDSDFKELVVAGGLYAKEVVVVEEDMVICK
jgi:hypothetical protein